MAAQTQSNLRQRHCTGHVLFLDVQGDNLLLASVQALAFAAGTVSEPTETGSTDTGSFVFITAPTGLPVTSE